MKRYDNFHVCLISPISYWHVTCLSRHSYMLMNEWKNPHHSQSKVVCRNFLGLWVLKHSKIYITAGRQWLLKFPRRGRNTESYLLSGFGNGIFRGSERKSTSGRFATSRVWLCTWINFGSRQGKVNNWEFCKLKVTSIVCFLMIQSIFPHEPYRQRTLRLFFADCRSFFFLSLTTSTFLVRKGQLCL